MTNMPEKANHVSLIVTVKDRVDHFIQTFPSLITQYGVCYELVLVNFNSTDSLEKTFLDEIAKREIMFSPYLRKIVYVKLLEDLKFNPRKAKNLGVANVSSYSDILAFSDVDTFLGMDYLSYWASKIEVNASFFVTRQQDTKAALPCRLKKEINYGNIIVFKEDCYDIKGWDESVTSYGGDDDDFCHRLKLKGLREINPITFVDAKQYSILHEDDLRRPLMEDTNRGIKEDKFEKIYSNKIHDKSECIFLHKTGGVVVQNIYNLE